MSWGCVAVREGKRRNTRGVRGRGHIATWGTVHRDGFPREDCFRPYAIYRAADCNSRGTCTFLETRIRYNDVTSRSNGRWIHAAVEELWGQRQREFHNSFGKKQQFARGSRIRYTHSSGTQDRETCPRRHTTTTCVCMYTHPFTRTLSERSTAQQRK